MSHKDKKNATSFKKGVSGNPKGRPKGLVGIRKQLELLAKKYKMTPAQYWFEVMQNASEPTKMRLEAAKLIAQYTHGTPQQSIELSGETTQTVVSVKLPDQEDWNADRPE